LLIEKASYLCRPIKNTRKWHKNVHISLLKGKEPINMVSEQEWNLLMAEEYWLHAEKEVEKN